MTATKNLTLKDKVIPQTTRTVTVVPWQKSPGCPNDQRTDLKDKQKTYGRTWEPGLESDEQVTDR